MSCSDSGMSTVRCQRCGLVGNASSDSSIRLTWVMDRDADQVRWTCPRCAGENVRAMEAKLDLEWW